MGPGAVGMAATQVNVFVNTVLATSTVEGAVSWLNYAFRLMYLPIGLFGVSIATAALPTVSRQSTQQDSVAVRETVTNSLSLMLMLNVPATVGLVVLAEPIVRVLLRTRPLHASRYARHSCGAAVLFHRPDRLLGRPYLRPSSMRSGTIAHRSSSASLWCW